MGKVILFVCLAVLAAVALVLVLVCAAAWAARSHRRPTPTQQTENPYRRFYGGDR